VVEVLVAGVLLHPILVILPEHLELKPLVVAEVLVPLLLEQVVPVS